MDYETGKQFEKIIETLENHKRVLDDLFTRLNELEKKYNQPDNKIVRPAG